MTPTQMLQQAQTEGLTVEERDCKLVVEGETFEGPLARLIVSRDKEVLAHLRGEPVDETPGGDGKPKANLTRMIDVEARPVQWMWPERFAAGRISMLVGMPGEGKSFLTCDMASRVSTGTPWADGQPCERGSVILITGEDDPGDVIRPRLDAHRADVSKIFLLTGSVRIIEGEEHEQLFTLADVLILEQALAKVRDCKLIVIDPIGSFLGGGTDAHRDNEVRAVLAPIAQLAEKSGAAVLIVAHRRKSAASHADDTVLGSRAFTGIARSVWHLSRDGEDKNRRLLLPGKSNLAAEQDGLAFSIGGEPASIHWEADPVEMNANDQMAAEQSNRKNGPPPDDREKAEAWLLATLALGPRLSKEVDDEGANAHCFAKRTIARARKAIGVEAFREKIPGPWYLRLPTMPPNPQGVEPGGLGSLGKNPGNNAISIGEDSNNAKFISPGIVGKEWEEIE